MNRRFFMTSIGFAAGAVSFIFLTAFAAQGADGQRPLTRKEALVLAEQTAEAKALYGLNDGRYVNCIEKSVVRPCETDWVTCIDEAWVVKFTLGKVCGIEHDGRLDLVLLVDAREARVISRYPESEYYLQAGFCQMDDDCMMLSGGKCVNFIYGQLDKNNRIKGQCRCREGMCRQDAESK